MSQTITITKKPKVSQTSNNINLSEAIEKAVNNISNLDPEVQPIIIEKLNEALNNKNHEDNLIVNNINDNRTYLVELSKNLTPDQLRSLVINLCHSSSISGFQVHNYEKIICEFERDLNISNSENEILREENAKFYKIINESNEETKAMGERARQTTIECQEALNKTVTKTMPISKILLKRWK